MTTMPSRATVSRKPTADELKAAEAAYQGRPFNEQWSEAARAVYEGIRAAARKRQAKMETPPPAHAPAETESELELFLEPAEKGEE